MNRQEIIQKLQEELLTFQIYRKRYDAALSAYQAACLSNNVSECDLQRQNIHTIVDAMLDSISLAQMLERQLLYIH